MMQRTRRAVTANADGDRPQKSGNARDGEGHGARPVAVRGRAILALLSENTIGKAAAKCGVNEKTLRRWRTTDEDFKRELADARRLVYEDGMNRVQALTAMAIDTLAALMCRTMPPNVRLGAARTVAELGAHHHDADMILRRLDDIEAHQRQQDTAGRQ